MINAIFHAHSGIRYLILLAGVVALVLLAMGAFGNRPYDKRSRVAMAVFTGLLDLQVVLGVLMAILGCFYPALFGHLLMMLLAAAAAHACSLYARRQTDAKRAHTISLAGVVLALVLLVGGIAAIQRSPLGSTGRPTCAAAR
ncbi:MAG TPA: hypothetical protein VF771_08005 [Longimicrobiaceae bacterium]